MSRDIPPLNALRAFESAARLLSVSKAGDELHVTHGAISRQIRLLETSLGVELFEKEGRGVKLTNAGMQLRDASAAAFDRIAGACADIRHLATNGPFVLACPGSLLARWFIPRLDKLNHDLPQLRLQLTAGEGELDPRNPNVHATLCFAAPPWPQDMQVYDLGAEQIGAVISPRHVHYEALANAPVAALLTEPLMYPASRPQAWTQWAQAHALPADRLQLGTAFEHLYYLLEAATAGLGVAIAPQQVVADDLAAHRLEAPWGFVETPARLSLWVPQARADQRSGALAEWLKNELTKQRQRQS
ncbi:LysR family transcriptional regulator [Advenella kashmirensis W13003]|uniref:LysR family transcriptional regulator n=1 Tax=Advenella kashmirensis W13003 TaxID=1424334 RepID=V8QXX8_9BURK|nr:LysR family transcriptional regulator [Advenella kashmirensis]ETF04165.1 LysR family transcriptional regulator [Advenella kashmirensis W13003]